MSKRKQSTRGIIEWSDHRIYIFMGFAVILCFGRSINNDFALDDSYYINNPYVNQGVSAGSKIFTTHTIQKDNERQIYRPIPALTFAIEKSIFGEWSATRAHIVSIILYLGIVFLLFHILCRLLSKKKRAIVFWTCFLFLLHPIHTEVIYNIKCRDELLAMLFGMSALRIMLSHKVRYYHIIVSAMCLLLALLSKLTAAPFLLIIPTVLLLRSQADRRIAYIFIGSLVILLLSFRVLVVDQLLDRSDKIRKVYYYENPYYVEKGNLLERVPTAISTMGHYLEKLIFPYPLASYYGYAALKVGKWTDLRVWLWTLLFIVLGYLAYRWRDQVPLFGIGLTALIFLLVPYSNLIVSAPGIFAERFSFLASIGFCLAISALLHQAYLHLSSEGSQFSLRIFKVVCLLSMIGALTWSNIRGYHWKDELTLLRHDVHAVPESAKIHAMLANVLFRKVPNTGNIREKTMEINEAILHYQEAVRIYDGYAIAWNNLGTMLVGYKNDREGAKNAYTNAIEHDPSYAVAYFGLGYVFEQENDFEMARKYYRETLKHDPTYRQAQVRLAALK